MNKGGRDAIPDGDRGWKGSRVAIREEAGGDEIQETESAATKHDPGHRPSSASDRGGYKGVKGRSKPGAALALAKRESAAIVASQGQKITF